MNLQVYPPWVFFSLFKLYKRYHIAQRITNYVYFHTDFCYALLTAKQSCYNKIYCKANRLLRSRESARNIFARQLSDLILSNKRVQLSNSKSQNWWRWTLIVAPVWTSNQMFGRAILYKLLECICVFSPQNCPNQTCGYWLITSNQETLGIETSLLTAGN